MVYSRVFGKYIGVYIYNHVFGEYMCNPKKSSFTGRVTLSWLTHTCQPIQFTSIKHSFSLGGGGGGGGDMATLENGYRKT